jgi:DHA1 family purine base/nucleoside efflux pump-like MFS transporter
MSDEPTAAKRESPKKLFVPSLTVLIFAISMSSVTLSLFLPEIAKTFLGSADQGAVGIASQTGAVNSAAEVVLAFVMSVIAVRFRHKSLLIAGAVIVVFSNVGSFFAPDFMTFQIFFAWEGAGSVMVSILAITLIGNNFASNKKARAISWFVAGTYLAGLVGVPVLLLISNVAGWRSIFLLFTLPVSLAGLFLALIAIPSTTTEQQPKPGTDNYVRNFRQVLTNKSASTCLIGTLVGNAAVVALFVLAFYRQQFSLSINWAVGIGLINTAFFVIGSLIGGKLISRFGSKPVAVLCGLVSGVLTMAFFNIPILWLALIVNFASVIVGAFGVPAFVCLVVDQVPESRGTMMSLHRIARNAGEAIGAAIGGVLLALFSYQVLGIGFGVIMMASAAIFLLVEQPIET